MSTGSKGFVHRADQLTSNSLLAWLCIYGIQKLAEVRYQLCPQTLFWNLSIFSWLNFTSWPDVRREIKGMVSPWQGVGSLSSTSHGYWVICLGCWYQRPGVLGWWKLLSLVLFTDPTLCSYNLGIYLFQKHNLNVRFLERTVWVVKFNLNILCSTSSFWDCHVLGSA